MLSSCTEILALVAAFAIAIARSASGYRWGRHMECGARSAPATYTSSAATTPANCARVPWAIVPAAITQLTALNA